MNVEHEGQQFSILLKFKPGYFIERQRKDESRAYKNKLFILPSLYNNLILLTTTKLL